MTSFPCSWSTTRASSRTQAAAAREYQSLKGYGGIPGIGAVQAAVLGMALARTDPTEQTDEVGGRERVFLEAKGTDSRDLG